MYSQDPTLSALLAKSLRHDLSVRECVQLRTKAATGTGLIQAADSVEQFTGPTALPEDISGPILPGEQPADFSTKAVPESANSHSLACRPTASARQQDSDWSLKY